MAHQPTNVQYHVAAPVALTEQELQTAMSTPTIQQRIADVNAIAGTIANANYSNPIVLTKAFEMFQISTHNVHSIGSQDSHDMGKLFSAAQASLQRVQDCILTRLGFTTDDINVDELDKQYLTVPFESPGLRHKRIAELRFTVLNDLYTEIVKTDQSLSDFPRVQQVIRIALGEAVRYYHDSSGWWTNLTLLRETDLQNPWDQHAWNVLMCKFATAVLFMMAKSVGDKFGGCIVELLGTKIPATGFAFE